MNIETITLTTNQLFNTVSIKGIQLMIATNHEKRK